MNSVFKFALSVPAVVGLPSDSGPMPVDRETFFGWLWHEWGERGLEGIHEGTLLSDEAAQQGLETESWTVDSAEAPRGRDWVGQQNHLEAELYFGSLESAEKASHYLRGAIPELGVGSVTEQKHQDWDAEWKASFLNAGEGVFVPPFWRVLPPWSDKHAPSEKVLKINPGAGFGTGTHETTQLCLQLIGEVASGLTWKGLRALDFGSGSGILSIALASFGAEVDAVEVDPLAIDNARENTTLNSISGSVRFAQHLDSEDRPNYQLIVANILKPVLLEHAAVLVRRLLPKGKIILSGLIEKDVVEVRAAYLALLPGSQAREVEKGEWRALVFET